MQDWAPLVNEMFIRAAQTHPMRLIFCIKAKIIPDKKWIYFQKGWYSHCQVNFLKTPFWSHLFPAHQLPVVFHYLQHEFSPHSLTFKTLKILFHFLCSTVVTCHLPAGILLTQFSCTPAISGPHLSFFRVHTSHMVPFFPECSDSTSSLPAHLPPSFISLSAFSLPSLRVWCTLDSKLDTEETQRWDIVPHLQVLAIFWGNR